MGNHLQPNQCPLESGKGAKRASTQSNRPSAIRMVRLLRRRRRRWKNYCFLMTITARLSSRRRRRLWRFFAAPARSLQSASWVFLSHLLHLSPSFVCSAEACKLVLRLGWLPAEINEIWRRPTAISALNEPFAQLKSEECDLPRVCLICALWWEPPKLFLVCAFLMQHHVWSVSAVCSFLQFPDVRYIFNGLRFVLWSFQVVLTPSVDFNYVSCLIFSYITAGARTSFRSTFAKILPTNYLKLFSFCIT